MPYLVTLKFGRQGFLKPSAPMSEIFPISPELLPLGLDFLCDWILIKQVANENIESSPKVRGDILVSIPKI